MNQLISYANDMWNCVKTIFGVIIDEVNRCAKFLWNSLKSYNIV